VKFAIAPLDVAYSTSCGEGWKAWIDEVVMIAAPGSKCSVAALVSQNKEYTLVLMMRSSVSVSRSSILSTVAWAPATITSRSRPPSPVTAASTRARH
jgi:hypothetical protein